MKNIFEIKKSLSEIIKFNNTLLLIKTIKYFLFSKEHSYTNTMIKHFYWNLLCALKEFNNKISEIHFPQKMSVQENDTVLIHLEL